MTRPDNSSLITELSVSVCGGAAVGLTCVFWSCGSVGRPVEYSSVLSTLTSCISVWVKLNMRPDSSVVMDRA